MITQHSRFQSGIIPHKMIHPLFPLTVDTRDVFGRFTENSGSLCHPFTTMFIVLNGAKGHTFMNCEDC